MTHPAEDSERLSALERHVASLEMDLQELRGLVQSATAPAVDSVVVVADRFAGSRAPPVPLSTLMHSALRQSPQRAGEALADRPSLSHRLPGGLTLSGVELESIVGRYGTLALAALVILMAVGAVIKMAVQRGLLTPEVRVISGAMAAALVAAAGVFFRRRGERRYGSVLLAIALTIVDLVAWGAGPLLHLLPVTAVLVAVDVASLALASLALRDESEFLFSVSVAGALSAPFVTSDGNGTRLALLLYGGAVLSGGLRSARDGAWMRAFVVLVAGALLYAISASALPATGAWYGPFLVTFFAAGCTMAALLFGEPAWRGELPRAYLAVALVGVLNAWGGGHGRSFGVTLAVAMSVAAVTYASLFVRQVSTRYWTESAVLLPLLSLAIAYRATKTGWSAGAVCTVWTVMAVIAWRVERARDEWSRAGAHLLAASVLGCLAIIAGLWPYPLPFVAALAIWGALLAALAREERSSLPLVGMSLSLALAGLSSFDQLASRSAYSYMPFLTRSSASAGAALLGLVLAAVALAGGTGRAGALANRQVRFGVMIAFAILWGRMEMANAFSADVAAFLLTCYYAACGVMSILTGRRLGIGQLRVAGLILCMYAAVKAMVVVTDIGSVLLRVSAWVAVGVFLLGAGYFYRDAQVGEARGDLTV